MVERRIFGLDAMRTTAIIMVVLNHSIGVLKPAVNISVIGNSLGKLIALFQPMGMIGVELFFVLSGFLIGTIIIRQFLKRESYYDLKSLVKFWSRRWFRTIPTYILILFVVFALYNHWDSRYIYFGQCINSNRIFFFAESWSLCVEEWFYLIFPLYLYIVSHLFKKKGKEKQIIFVVVSFIVITTIIRIGTIVYNNFSLHEHLQIRNMTFLRLDAIAFGVLIALIQTLNNTILHRNVNLLFTIGIVGVLFIVLINYLGNHPSLLWYERLHWFKCATDLTIYTLIPAFLSMLIPWFYSLKRSDNWRLITNISIYSYSIYLLHSAIILDKVIKPLIQIYPHLYFALFTFYLLIIFATAKLLYNFFEKPTTNLREKLIF